MATPGKVFASFLFILSVREISHKMHRKTAMNVKLRFKLVHYSPYRPFRRMTMSTCPRKGLFHPATSSRPGPIRKTKHAANNLLLVSKLKFYWRKISFENLNFSRLSDYLTVV